MYTSRHVSPLSLDIRSIAEIRISTINIYIGNLTTISALAFQPKRYACYGCITFKHFLSRGCDNIHMMKQHNIPLVLP